MLAYLLCCPKTFWPGRVESEVKEVMASMSNRGLTLHRPALLVNEQGPRDKPVARQGYHVDLKPGQWWAVAIAPVKPVSLLVVPGSHSQVHTLQRLQEMVTNGVMSEADLDAWLSSRSYKAVRLELTLGDILFMSGDTVHAGDRGKDRQPSPRIHWYMTQENVKENETTHLIDLHPKFPALFIQVRVSCTALRRHRFSAWDPSFGVDQVAMTFGKFCRLFFSVLLMPRTNDIMMALP